MNSVARAWENRQKRVQNFRFKWNDKQFRSEKALVGKAGNGGQQQNPKPDIRDAAYALTMKGSDKMRWLEDNWNLDSNGVLKKQKSISVTDGQTSKVFDAAGAIRRDQGLVGNAQAVMRRPSPSMSPILMNYRPFHSLLGELTQEAIKTAEMAPKRASIGDKPCIKASIKLHPTFDRIGHLWIDPERDYVPMRFSRESGGRIRYQLDWLNYEKSGKEWVPTEWKATHFNEDGTIRSSHTCKATERSINGNIDDKEFELTFPPGTLILNRAKRAP